MNVLVDDKEFCDQSGAKSAQRLLSLCHFHSSVVAKRAWDVVNRYALRGEEELKTQTPRNNTLPILLSNLLHLQVLIGCIDDK